MTGKQQIKMNKPLNILRRIMTLVVLRLSLLKKLYLRDLQARASQSSVLRRGRNKMKSRFFRGHAPREKHFPDRKCASAASARGGLHPFSEMPAFLRERVEFLDTLRRSMTFVMLRLFLI